MLATDSKNSLFKVTESLELPNPYMMQYFSLMLLPPSIKFGMCTTSCTCGFRPTFCDALCTGTSYWMASRFVSQLVSGHCALFVSQSGRPPGASLLHAEQYLASQRFSSVASGAERRNALIARHSNMDGGSPPLDPIQGQAIDDAVDDLNLPTPPKCSPISRPSSLMGLPALQALRPEMTMKAALVAKPSVVSREKSVAMMRFKRSKTRRFFHPYAKVGDFCLVSYCKLIQDTVRLP